MLLCAGWGSNQFTPMILVYHQSLGLSTGTLEAMFGFYALGLAPGLLVAGAIADARGRRPVVVAAAAFGLLGSVALLAAGHVTTLLFVGRFLIGLSSGAAFSAGTVWLRELSLEPRGGASAQAIARRTVVCMTVGFALGPIVAGALAQWGPRPRVVPFTPHVLLSTLVLFALLRVPETLPPERKGKLGSRAVRTMLESMPALRTARFRFVIAPMAPWIFAAPAIAFALLPSIVGTESESNGVLITAAITALTAFAGVAAQAVARRLETRGGTRLTAIVGLFALIAALVVSAGAAQAHDSWLLVPTSLLFGGAYGLCLVAGLAEVQQLADPQAQSGLTAAFYAITYIGFAAPYAITLAAHEAGYPAWLLVTAAIAAATVLQVARATRSDDLRDRLPATVAPAPEKTGACRSSQRAAGSHEALTK